MAMTANAARALGLLAMLLGVAWPGATWAADPGGRPVGVELEVRVSIGGPDEALLQEAVEERVKARLAELGHAVRLDEPIDIDVSVGWHDEAETTYALAVVLRRNGELVSHATETCPRCGTAELFERLAERIDRAEDHLLSMAAESAPAEAEPSPTREITPVPPRPRPTLTGLGWAGVAVAGTGLVVGAVGAGVWSKGRVFDSEPGSREWLTGTDYRPPGIALVATGSALLVGGIVMLAIDVARARHRRVRVAATFDRAGATAVVTGRF
jgi:hypothetical protein